MINRTSIKYLTTFIVCLFFLITSCESEHGIEPKPLENQEFGFGGNIVFYGAWPDSIKRMILIVFKDPPGFVITNIGYLSNELPLKVPNYHYSSLDSATIPLTPVGSPTSTYSYVAVAQQSTDLLSLDPKDWFVTGIFYENGDTTKPGALTIQENTFVDNINIYCDFDNPPPQPWGGN